MRDVLMPAIGVVLIVVGCIAIGGEEKFLLGLRGTWACIFWAAVGAALVIQKHWQRCECGGWKESCMGIHKERADG